MGERLARQFLSYEAILHQALFSKGDLNPGLSFQGGGGGSFGSGVYATKPAMLLAVDMLCISRTGLGSAGQNYTISIWTMINRRTCIVHMKAWIHFFILRWCFVNAYIAYKNSIISQTNKNIRHVKSMWSSTSCI